MSTTSMGQTGTSDPVYDLISVAYHALQGAETHEQYAQDAQQQGDQELADYFRKTQQQFQRHCQVASSRRVMGKSGRGLGCRRNLGNIVPRAEGGIASRAILVGIEVMTTKLEMVVDPTVGGEETLRMTR